MSSIKQTNTPIELPYFYVGIDLRTIVDYSDPAYAERKQDFINRAYSLQAEAKEETERLTVNIIEFLDAKHEAIVIQCKEALNNFNEVNGKAAYFQARERQLSKELTDASFALKLWKDSPLMLTYATKNDIQKWNDELVALQLAESSKLSEYHNHQHVQSLWMADAKQLKAKHDALAVEEFELRNRLDRLRGKVTGPQPTAIGLSA